MKKKTAVLLMAAIFCLEFTGCAGKSDKEKEAVSNAIHEEEIALNSEETYYDLTDIYINAEAFAEDLAAYEQMLLGLSTYAGSLNREDNILSFMKQKDVVSQKLRSLTTYGTLLCARNQDDGEAIEILNQGYMAMAAYSEVTSFYGSELLANPDEFLNELVKQDEMSPFACEISRLREGEAHSLPQEQMIMATPIMNAANGAYSLYAQLVTIDMVRPMVKGPEGKEVVLDDAWAAWILTNSKEQKQRRETAEELYRTYGQYRNTLAQNMDNFVRSSISLSQMLQYDSTREYVLAQSAVPSLVYDNLMEAANENLDTAHRVTTLRKEVLGLEEIYYSDMSCSLASELPVSFSYEKAEKLLEEALVPLGKEYQDKVETAFEERWIDVYPAQGKQGGAFTTGLYGVHPYIFTNYTNDFNSVNTLAHELGHAMHHDYSAENQDSDFNSAPTNFTSEVAAVTNELLFLDYMIEKAETEDDKLYYLIWELNTLYNTFYMQTMYAEFEENMYRTVEGGGALTADALEELWLSVSKKYLGPDCTLIEGQQYGWALIPHFYSNYYVYQYAASVAAASTLSDGILSKEPQAVKDYLTFLKAGDSGDGVEILKLAGVDMDSPNFAADFNVRMNEVIDQIEKLKKNKSYMKKS